MNKTYLEQGKLKLELLGRGFAWLDTGTHDSLLMASNFVKTIEDRQGFKIACPEEIALTNGWIDYDELQCLIDRMGENQYKDFLIQLIKSPC